MGDVKDDMSMVFLQRWHKRNGKISVVQAHTGIVTLNKQNMILYVIDYPDPVLWMWTLSGTLLYLEKNLVKESETFNDRDKLNKKRLMIDRGWVDCSDKVDVFLTPKRGKRGTFKKEM